MKRLIAIPVLFVFVIVFWAVAKADQHEPAAAIKAAIQKTVAAWNAGDAEAIAKHHHSSGTSYFYAEGQLLSLFDTAELQAWFDAGGKVNIQGLSHLDVKVYGDAAVSTTYWTGAVTYPSGESRSGTRRTSNFWIKEDGTWKRVHSHGSPLIIEPLDNDDDDDDDD